MLVVTVALSVLFYVVAVVGFVVALVILVVKGRKRKGRG